MLQSACIQFNNYVNDINDTMPTNDLNVALLSYDIDNPSRTLRKYRQFTNLNVCANMVKDCGDWKSA